MVQYAYSFGARRLPVAAPLKALLGPVSIDFARAPRRAKKVRANKKVEKEKRRSATETVPSGKKGKCSREEDTFRWPNEIDVYFSEIGANIIAPGDEQMTIKPALMTSAMAKHIVKGIARLTAEQQGKAKRSFVWLSFFLVSWKSFSKLLDAVQLQCSAL